MNQHPLSVSSDNDPHPDPYVEVLVSDILADISARYRLDLTRDMVAMERISEAASRALKELETKSETEIHLPYLSANPAGPIHLNRKVTRGELGLDGESHPAAGKPLEPIGGVAGPALQPIRIELPDRKPLVTMTLLVVTIFLYIAQILSDFFLGYDLPAALGMKSNQLILAGQYWRLVTPMFLHGSILHLGFNMYALYILGRRVERFFGSSRFLGLYLVAGISGNLFSFLFTSAPSLGSSTAIFGLLGAEGVFIYQHRKLFGEQFKIALRQIVQVAAINIVIGLSPGIDNWGHIGGLIGGGIFCWFGGPSFAVLNTPPVLRLQDQRKKGQIGIVLAIELLVLIGLALGIVILRS